MLRKRFLWYPGLLVLVLLLVSCAGLPPRPEPEPSPQPQPQPQPELQPPPQIYETIRKFPDFVALVAQPGDTLSSLASKYLNDSSMDWLLAEFNGITFLNPGQEVIIPLHVYRKGGLSLEGYQTVPVLSYHKFSKDRADVLTVKESVFEEQMRFLKGKGYRVITMDELFNFLDYKQSLPKKSVVITIDDDWYSTYEIAFPILKKYGYPATLFVYTDLIIPGGKTLSWEILSAMAKNGMDIQCHTKSHRNLDKRNGQESFREYFEAVKKELVESTEMIKKRLNKEVKYLAYPYGDTNPLIIALLTKLGYRGAFTVERGSNPFFIHSYRINRSMIYGTFSLKDFENNLAYFSDKEMQ